MLQTYVLNGIPQDSVLGPLRLILFVNYRLDVVPTNILTFANDTKLYCEVNNQQQLVPLQQDLRSLKNRTET